MITLKFFNGNVESFNTNEEFIDFTIIYSKKNDTYLPDPTDFDMCVKHMAWRCAEITMDKEHDPNYKEVPDICDRIHTVGELKAFLEQYDDNDCVVMETIDLETGDVIDLYPFHMDVIEGIQLNNGEVIREIRFCQENNNDM